jgi:acetyl-CoA carboxylase/biotin carboxylase 1
VTRFAAARGVPRVYLSSNSGARIGLVEALKPLVGVKWVSNDPSKGLEYLYVTPEDLEKLPEGSVDVKPKNRNGHHEIEAIIGSDDQVPDGIGVENLRGSGTIAGETSRAYEETFTLSYVSGRSVGIGAYLNRLGQRVIQMKTGPMILTGFQALNKLLGKAVYTSQDQLGGQQIMVPNGVTHLGVDDDYEGSGRRPMYFC